MTYAVQSFVEEKLGAKYVESRSVEFAKSFEESGPSTPIFFILSPGVNPLKVQCIIKFSLTLFQFLYLCLKGCGEAWQAAWLHPSQQKLSQRVARAGPGGCGWKCHGSGCKRYGIAPIDFCHVDHDEIPCRWPLGDIAKHPFGQDLAASPGKSHWGVQRRLTPGKYSMCTNVCNKRFTKGIF